MHRAIFGILLTIWVSIVQAAAVPAYSGKVNNSIGSILNSKIGKTSALGAEYDAKFQRTMSAITAGVTGTATTLVAGGAAVAVGAISWPALLVSAGISGVVSGAVQLGMDGLINWLWPDSNHPTQTQISGTGLGVGDPKNFPVIPSNYPAILDYYGTGGDIWFAASTSYLAARHIRTILTTCPGGGIFCGTGTSVGGNLDYTFGSTYGGPYPGPNGYWSKVYSRQISTTTNPTTVTYQIVFDFSPPSGVTLLPPAYTPHWQAVGQTINDLPQGYVAQPLSDQQLAAIANAVWKNAPATATQGDTFLYNAADPITAADIAAWRATNPQLVPTVNDFISPVAAPGATVVTIPNPGTEAPPVTPPGVTPPTTNTFTLDWGQFQEPTLDETPTTPSILDPIFAMWPQWNDYTFPSHTSQCPTPTFSALNHTFTFDHMCIWVEMIRPGVQAAFALVWALAVVFIVMGA